jgi:hypothetical protein
MAVCEARFAASSAAWLFGTLEADTAIAANMERTAGKSPRFVYRYSIRDRMEHLLGTLLMDRHYIRKNALKLTSIITIIPGNHGDPCIQKPTPGQSASPPAGKIVRCPHFQKFFLREKQIGASNNQWAVDSRQWVVGSG